MVSDPLPTPMNGARSVGAKRFCSGQTVPWTDVAAIEKPVALIYNRFPFAVMLATPMDLDDFAIGFSLTEGIVGEAGDIGEVTMKAAGDGLEIAMSIPKDRYMALRERHRRNLMAGSSCGLCGADDFSEALRPVDPVRSDQSFAADAIHRAMRELPENQVLNRKVGALHGAAFAGPDGRILALREDVGRHNALDKLIGFLARSGIDRARGFFAVSSRCSFEMVRKTAAAGVPLIASISAPTSLAIDLAEECGVGLAAFAREGRFNLYAGERRIAG
jgi:FdhD protein